MMMNGQTTEHHNPGLLSAQNGGTSGAFDALDGGLERDGWWRAISATFAFLNMTSRRLEEAEAKIAAQERRIFELQERATMDDLTGLLNRRGFFDAFSAEIDRTRRGYGQGGLLILIDLDNFKVINDTYGHEAGDATLRLIAKTLRDNSRMMDACARLDGDEFVLLLANTQRDKALVRAQNLIKQLNNLSLVWHGAEIPIRASLGLKDYKPGDTAQKIFSEADLRLYAEKRRQRNFYDKGRATA
jgi:diguanylate cyclase (GGDEF)-like protein